MGAAESQGASESDSAAQVGDRQEVQQQQLPMQIPALAPTVMHCDISDEGCADAAVQADLSADVPQLRGWGVQAAECRRRRAPWRFSPLAKAVLGAKEVLSTKAVQDTKQVLNTTGTLGAKEVLNTKGTPDAKDVLNAKQVLDTKVLSTGPAAGHKARAGRTGHALHNGGVEHKEDAATPVRAELLGMAAAVAAAACGARQSVLGYLAKLKEDGYTDDDMFDAAKAIHRACR